MEHITFTTFVPMSYVTTSKVSTLLDKGKIVEETETYIRIQINTGEIAIVDQYGRVTWE